MAHFMFTHFFSRAYHSNFLPSPSVAFIAIAIAPSIASPASCILINLPASLQFNSCVHLFVLGYGASKVW